MRLAPAFLSMLASLHAATGAAAGTPAQAGPFLQEMLPRGIASIRGWPDNAIAARITGVQVSAAQPCTVQVTAANGHSFKILMDKAAALKLAGPPAASVRYIDIAGGVAPYDSIGVFVDDPALLDRVYAAFNAMRTGCDKSQALGF